MIFSAEKASILDSVWIQNSARFGMEIDDFLDEVKAYSIAYGFTKEQQDQMKDKFKEELAMRRGAEQEYVQTGLNMPNLRRLLLVDVFRDASRENKTNYTILIVGANR